MSTEITKELVEAHVLSLIVVTTAVALVSSLMVRQWRLWRMAGVTGVPIAAAPEGKLVRIVGMVARGRDGLTSPLTRRPCIYYRVVVSPVGSTEELGSESCAVPFVIADATGRAHVESVGADVLAVLSHETLVTRGEALTAEQAAFLDRRCYGNHRGEALCFREWVIAIDDEVAVVGAGMLEVDPDGGSGEQTFRGAAPTQLHFARALASRLVISNEPVATARRGEGDTSGHQ